MRERSFGTTLRMLASAEPAISHEAITSQSAMRFLSSSARFSPTVSGTGAPHTAATTRQKRFCGWW